MVCKGLSRKIHKDLEFIIHALPDKQGSWRFYLKQDYGLKHIFFALALNFELRQKKKRGFVMLFIMIALNDM